MGVYAIKHFLKVAKKEEMEIFSGSSAICIASCYEHGEMQKPWQNIFICIFIDMFFLNT